jgi:hypothetical protein
MGTQSYVELIRAYLRGEMAFDEFESRFQSSRLSDDHGEHSEDAVLALVEIEYANHVVSPELEPGEGDKLHLSTEDFKKELEGYLRRLEATL